MDGSFFCCRAQERPANMDCGAEIYFIVMLGLFLFNDRMVYQSLRNVICNHSCPDFLLHIFCLISMEIAESDSIFQLTERGFDALYESS